MTHNEGTTRLIAIMRDVPTEAPTVATAAGVPARAVGASQTR
jgi:hypothetical protein